MADKMIMEFLVSIERDDCTSFETANGRVAIIPFTATVESELFCGTTRPGAADVQVTNAGGTRHMCAKYAFEGTDRTGTPCHLFVENNGYFMRGTNPTPFEATPTFMTDSIELAPYLHGAHFRAEGHPREGGVSICIFDVDVHD